MSEPNQSHSRRRRIRPWRLAAALAGLAAATVLTVGMSSAQAQSTPSAVSFSSGSGGRIIGPVINGVRWQ